MTTTQITWATGGTTSADAYRKIAADADAGDPGAQDALYDEFVAGLEIGRSDREVFGTKVQGPFWAKATAEYREGYERGWSEAA